jgi:hypothetical protein
MRGENCGYRFFNFFAAVRLLVFVVVVFAIIYGGASSLPARINARNISVRACRIFIAAKIEL